MKQIQNYTIIKKIGEGTSGETFLVERDQNQYALKQLKIGEIDRWKTVERFQRESDILKKLNHRAIPKYIEFIEDGDTLAIVQQYIPGDSFRQIIKEEKRFATSELVDILKQGLELLNYLEIQGVIHRDLSPQNIILDPNGKLWFIDFGAVQRRLSDRNSTITTMGTFGYMAPEQIMGNTTHQSDLFSFGISMISLISGRTVDQLPEDLMSGTLSEEVFLNLPEYLQHVLKKMVEPGLKKRFQSSAEALQKIGMPYQRSIKTSDNNDVVESSIYRKTKGVAYVLKEYGTSNLFCHLQISRYWISILFNMVLINILLRFELTTIWYHIPINLGIFLFHYLYSKIFTSKIFFGEIKPQTLFKIPRKGDILYIIGEVISLERNQYLIWSLHKDQIKEFQLNEYKNIQEITISTSNKQYYLHFQFSDIAEDVSDTLQRMLSQ